MFAKAWAPLAILLAASLEVHGHAAVAPVLGLGSTAPQRSDVERPSTASPCGAGVNIASALGKSTPVQAAADGTFSATVTNFNAGQDGSRQVTAQVDATAAGKNFVPVTVSTNGDAAPTDVGSQPIVASLPAGTTCTGGTTGNLCLVSFKTVAGFGNCVAVQQGSGGAASSATNSTATNSTATDTGSAAASSGSVAAGSNSTDTAGTGSGAAVGGAAGSTAADHGKGKHKGKGKGKHGHGKGAAAAGNGNAKQGAAGAAGGADAAGDAAGAGSGSANDAGGADSGDAAGTADAAGSAGAAAQNANGNGKGNQTDLAKGQPAQGGTRAAKALLAGLQGSKEAVDHARRGIVSWIWA